MNKRKRSPSPSPERGQSPPRTVAVPESSVSPKRSRISSLFNLFCQSDSSKSPSRNGTKKDKKISFGGPQVFHFDMQSPARRRRPEGDDVLLDPQELASSKDGLEALRVEVECRKEEGSLDPKLNTKKLRKEQLVSLVAQEWRKDQLERLEQRGLACASDKKLSQRQLAQKIELLEELERKADLLMCGVRLHRLSPAALRKELETRKMDTRGDRAALERRLEEAWIKEGERFELPKGADAYAFGRHAVSARDLVDGLTDKELRARLLAWRVKKADVPASRDERVALLERLVLE